MLMKATATPQSGNEQYCRMQVTCPRCGGQALVPWTRLGKLLRCNACSAWCRLDRFGKPCEAAAPTGFWVQVRSSFTRWERVRVLLSTDAGLVEAMKANWRFAPAGALVAFLCIVGVSFALTRSPAVAPEVAEPRQSPESLEGRAAMWAKAWLADDTSSLLLLAEPSRDRHLRRWLSTHRPPRSGDGAQLELPQIEIAVKPRSESHLADVKVTIAFNQGASLRETTELRQLWHRRDGAWYFWPEF